LPEIAEIDLIRHFNNLSQRNFSIDTNFYPLGSCTMKYNPKRHERLSRLPGLVDLHPYQVDEAAQGMLAILFEMQEMLATLVDELRAVGVGVSVGEHLDAGQAGLVVVAVSDMGAEVERAMNQARKIEARHLTADTAAIEADAKSAQV